MFEILKYVNHLNEELDFGQNGLFVNRNELHDYEWLYYTENNKISYFDKGVQKRILPIVVADGSEGIDKVNHLMEICEKDVIASSPGKLIIGNYYLKCYVMRSRKTNYQLHKGYMNVELMIITDSASWVNELTKTFSGANTSGKNLDYPFDFPYDFASPNSISELNNESFTDVDFELIIYGEVTNPTLFIGGHEYSLTKYIAAGEYLTINSKEKTIVLNKVNGTKVNCFKDRNKDSYIFERIPSGIQAVTWSDDFQFTVTLFEERSEPKWI